jgi:hypothetical protein
LACAALAGLWASWAWYERRPARQVDHVIGHALVLFQERPGDLFPFSPDARQPAGPGDEWFEALIGAGRPDAATAMAAALVDPYHRSRAFTAIAAAEARAGRVERFKGAAARAVEAGRIPHHFRTRAFPALAVTEAQSGQFPTALEVAEEANPDDSFKLDALWAIARAAAEAGQTRTALESARRYNALLTALEPAGRYHARKQGDGRDEGFYAAFDAAARSGRVETALTAAGMLKHSGPLIRAFQVLAAPAAEAPADLEAALRAALRNQGTVPQAYYPWFCKAAAHTGRLDPMLKVLGGSLDGGAWGELYGEAARAAAQVGAEGKAREVLTWGIAGLNEPVASKRARGDAVLNANIERVLGAAGLREAPEDSERALGYVALAEAAVAAGLRPEAKAVIGPALEAARRGASGNIPEARPSLFIAVAAAALEAGMDDKAAEALDAALRAGRLGYSSEGVQALPSDVWVAARLGQYPRALELARELDNPLSRCRAFLDVADQASRAGRRAVAEAALGAAIEEFKALAFAGGLMLLR